MNKTIVMTGPTGVGKTKLSITLAKKYNVSDNAIRKWFIQVGLPSKSKELKLLM